MSIQSEISRIKNNIKATYSVISEKGGTLPEAQNSTNLADTIRNLPAGGGDTIWAENYLKRAPIAGEKVLLIPYLNENFKSYDITNRDMPIVHNSFFKNNDLYTYTNNIYKNRYNSKTDSWEITKLCSNPCSPDKSPIFEYIDNQLCSQFISSYQTQFAEYPTLNKTESNVFYLGSAITDGVKKNYCIRYNNKYLDLHLINMSTKKFINTSLKRIGYSSIELPDYNMRFFIKENKLLYTYFNKIGLIDLSTSKYQIISDNDRSAYEHVYYTTGTSVGDYLIGTTANTNKAPYTNSKLKIRRINPDNTITLYDEPLFKEFEGKDCSVYYDTRLDILCIGTYEKAYLYQFDTINKTFSPIILNLPFTTLAQPTDTHRITFSENRSFVCHTFCNDKVYETKIYYLQNNNQNFCAEPMTNSIIYPDRTLIGYTTGQVSPEGLIEVKTIQPETIDINLNITPTPDNISIKGVKSYENKSL